MIVAAAGVAFVLAVLAVGAVLALRNDPRVRARLGAVVAWVRARGGTSDGAPDGASEPPSPARLACTPAVAAGTSDAPRTLAELGAAERATVLWQWADTAPTAGAERRALRDEARARGLAVVDVGGRGAVAATGPGDALRPVAARAPGAAAFLATAGSRSLCALD